MAISLKWLHRRRFKLLHWVPLLGAIGLIFLVAVFVVRSLSNFEMAARWQHHTEHVILKAEAYQKNLWNLQRSLRAYSTTGDTNELAVWETGRQTEAEQFKRLVDLTRDNPVQQVRLNLEISQTRRDVFTFSDRLIATCQQQGVTAAGAADPNGAETRTVFGRLNNLMNAVSAEEVTMLEQRAAAAESSFHETKRLLVLGSVLTVLLLTFASIVTARELKYRRQAETTLRRQLLLNQAILHSADYAIVTTDTTGVIQTFNSAAERMLGYPAEEVIGHTSPTLWRDPQELSERVKILSKQLGRTFTSPVEALAALVQIKEVEESEWTFCRKDGSRFIAFSVISGLTDPQGRHNGFVGIFRDITAQKSLETEREKLIKELQQALADVKTLSGLIPICSWCKKIRNDTGYWQSVEHYIAAHSEATFTHGMCPDCNQKFEAEILGSGPKNF
jgi:PAS domain S-box-containing protein